MSSKRERLCKTLLRNGGANKAGLMLRIYPMGRFNAHEPSRPPPGTELTRIMNYHSPVHPSFIKHPQQGTGEWRMNTVQSLPSRRIWWGNTLRVTKMPLKLVFALCSVWEISVPRFWQVSFESEVCHASGHVRLTLMPDCLYWTGSTI